jgi:hypothetical protein
MASSYIPSLPPSSIASPPAPLCCAASEDSSPSSHQGYGLPPTRHDRTRRHTSCARAPTVTVRHPFLFAKTLHKGNDQSPRHRCCSGESPPPQQATTVAEDLPDSYGTTWRAPTTSWQLVSLTNIAGVANSDELWVPSPVRRRADVVIVDDVPPLFPLLPLSSGSGIQRCRQPFEGEARGGPHVSGTCH